LSRLPILYFAKNYLNILQLKTNNDQEEEKTHGPLNKLFEDLIMQNVINIGGIQQWRRRVWK